MGHPESSNTGWAERHRDALTTHHSHEDVLNDREFERLLEACRDIPEPRGFEARFICLLGGRLGLRAGEIAHLKTGWIDWNRKLVHIPKHEPCHCGYCQRQARQEADHTDELTSEAALRTRWHPKTVAAARSIPFDLSLRIELCIERFANRYEGFPRSRSTINRRVKEAAEEAQLTGRVYPHCLRATAASHHAYKG
ncbi:MAG: tyrosine-type recombinase/integrase, partial [Salinirussus sp.]